MRHKLRKLPIFLLALVFLFEAWLWDVTGVAVAYIVGFVPIERYKRWFMVRIENFSPWLTLTVFAIPVLILLPFKFFALWMIAHDYVLGGLCMVVLAKLASFGVSSFLFMLCKPKLMQLRLVRWVYHTFHDWRLRAHRFVEPYMAAPRRIMAEWRARPRSELARLRARIHSYRKKKAPSA
jgi:hypothetical protein